MTHLELLRRSYTKNRPRRRSKVKTPQYPFGIEEAYQKELSAFFSHYRAAVHRIIFPALEGLINAQKWRRPTAPRMDDVGDDIEMLLKAVSHAYAGQVSDELIRRTIMNRALDINNFNKRDQGRVMASILGVNPIGSEMWVRQEVNLFTKTNISLIRNVEETTRQKLETSILTAVQRGQRIEVLAKDLDDVMDASESRLRLIARDQTSKFNGEITKLRQLEVGFPAFKWVTAHDARVRETHAHHDGVVYLWSDPPADTGAPGEDYQCRCVAIPATMEEFDAYQEAA